MSLLVVPCRWERGAPIVEGATRRRGREHVELRTRPHNREKSVVAQRERERGVWQLRDSEESKPRFSIYIYIYM
jgi:hypothetical protein